MERTTIMLPPELKSKAIRYSEHKGISLGQLIREALEHEINQQGNAEQSLDPLYADKVVFKGEAPHDLSMNHDAYLDQDQS
jgi:hypothetical protein